MIKIIPRHFQYQWINPRWLWARTQYHGAHPEFGEKSAKFALRWTATCTNIGALLNCMLLPKGSVEQLRKHPQQRACRNEFLVDKTRRCRKKAGEKKTVVFNGSKKGCGCRFVHRAFILLVWRSDFWFTADLQLKTWRIAKELAEYEQKAVPADESRISCSIVWVPISSLSYRDGTDSAIKYLSKFSKLMRLTNIPKVARRW